MMMIGDVMSSDAPLQQILQEPQASLYSIVSALNQSRATMADHAPGLARGFSSIGGNQKPGFVAGAEGNQEHADWVSGYETLAQMGVSSSVQEMGSFSIGGSQEFWGKQMEVSGKRSCLEMHNAGAKMVYDKCSLKIQVIDETALLETVPVPKSGKGRGKEMGFAKEAEGKRFGSGNQVLDEKAKQSRGKGKGARKAFDSNRRHKNLIHIPKAQRGNGAAVPKTKRVYSRKEMEALRFVQVVEQRKMWKNIYTGLGASVAREYDDLANVRHQKQVPNFDPRLQRYGKNPSPGILGVATRGRGYHMNVFVH